MTTEKHGRMQEPRDSIGAASEKSALRKRVLSARDSIDESTRKAKSKAICDRLCSIYDEAMDERDGEQRLGSERLSLGGPKQQPCGKDEPQGEFVPSSNLDCREKPVACVYCAFRSEVDLSAFAMHVWNSEGIVAFPCMEKAAASNPLVDCNENPGHPCRSRMTMRVVSREAYEESAAGNRDTAPFLCAVTKAFDPDDGRLSEFAIVEPEEVGMVVVPLVAYDDKGGRLGYGGGNYDEFLARVRPDAIVVGVGFAEQRVERVPREAHDITIPRIVSA